LGVTGGTSAMLEPIVPRDVFAWKRGETTATAGQLLMAENLVKRAIALLG